MMFRPDFSFFAFCPGLRRLRTLSLLLCCALPVAQAGTRVADNIGVVERFPAGSISSIEMAEHALSEVENERSALERRYTAEEQACYGRFFASNCLDAAKERRRAALSKLRPIEVEANVFKRRARVAEREEVLQSKQATSAETLPRMESTAATPADADEPAIAASPGHAVAAPIGDINASSRVARHNARLKQEQREEEAEAKKRSENTAAYLRKQEESLARQRELDSKKQEKARERNAKQGAGAG